MSEPIDMIETIVVVMMENRSFDHFLGYLSLPPYGMAVDGFVDHPAWFTQHANPFNGDIYPPFHLKEKQLPADPPHERYDISGQLGPPVLGVYPMNGFVGSYSVVQAISLDPTIAPLPAVMGYYSQAEVPMTHFLANSFGVCDKWFASLPTSTQPNRLMAMSGITRIDTDQSLSLPDQKLVYDWLTERNVRWRVYHEGLPFFTLMDRWIPEIISGPNFVPFSRLVVDVQEESPESFPQVLFVEPVYTDAPHLGTADDDHPPTSVDGGQAFLKRVYLSLISNPVRWAKTLMIVVYDEHGGFYDHVSPISLLTSPPPGDSYPPFITSGVRVPALVVSPLVDPGSVFSQTFDHTSVLKMLGQKFGGGSYSPEVDQRNVGNAADVLNRLLPRPEILAPPGYPSYSRAISQNGASFQHAANTMIAQNPSGTQNKFPELWHF